MADLLEHSEDIAIRVEVHGSLAVVAASDDLRFEAVELKALAGAHLRPGWTSAIQVFASAVIGCSKSSSTSPGGMRAGAMAEQTRRKHFGIVEHQAVAGLKECRQFAEHAIFPALLIAMEHQHARRGPIRKRLLRDRPSGQVIIELREIQTSR